MDVHTRNLGLLVLLASTNWIGANFQLAGTYSQKPLNPSQKARKFVVGTIQSLQAYSVMSPQIGWLWRLVSGLGRCAETFARESDRHGPPAPQLRHSDVIFVSSYLFGELSWWRCWCANHPAQPQC